MNSTRLSVLTACAVLLATSALGAEPSPDKKADAPLPYRWVFCFGYRRNAKDLAKVKEIADTAVKHRLNGMVLSSFGLDSITRWKKNDLKLLEEVRDHCAQQKIELIPTGFSAGYGGGALGHDRNFSAALPVEIDLLAEKGKAVPVAGPNLLKNGDLEQHRKGRFSEYGFHDAPGKVSFVDTVAASGKSSIRFENLGSGKHGHGRIMQPVKTKPGASYRFSLKIRTQDLKPAGAVRLLVLADGKTVTSQSPRVKSTQDWTEVGLDILNVKQKELRIYAGVWGAKSGKFWLDDLRLRSAASLNDIVRREGAPLELKSADGKKEFVEGKDFFAIRNLRSLPHIKLPPGSAILPGQKLKLSCYRTPYVTHSWGRQISLCMSNPKLYEYWEQQARELHDVLKCKRILLAMDEIRNGGGCDLCRKSGKTMAEILGACITKQREMFKKIDPKIEVLIWSDMLDPNHNAKNNYYGVVGDYTGSWKHVPRDLTIVCWYHKIRGESLPFFSKNGFATMGAAYYDAKDLAGSREWLESLKKTPNAKGIMYTTWQRKYELLGAFGDTVNGR